MSARRTIFQRYTPPDSSAGSVTFQVRGYTWWRLLAVFANVEATTVVTNVGVRVTDTAGVTMLSSGTPLLIDVGNTNDVQFGIGLSGSGCEKTSALGVKFGVAVIATMMTAGLADVEHICDGNVVIVTSNVDDACINISIVIEGQRIGDGG